VHARIAGSTLGKAAFAAAVSAALLLGLLGCEALLNVGGLSERPLDDGGAEGEVGVSIGDASTPVEAEARAREGGAPQTLFESGNEPEDVGPDDAADGAFSAPESASPAQDADGATFAPDGASVMETDAPVSDGDSGMDASDSAVTNDGSPTDGPAVDSGPPGTSYASCQAILTASPASASGTYPISPGGSSLDVYCDMDFAGGGWTLVQSTNGGACTPATGTAGTVTLGSCTYMPTALLAAIAEGSTTVHVRSASGSAAPAAYISSVTAVPIQNFRMGLVANANETVGDAGAEEAAWTVVGDPGNATSHGHTPQSILGFTCTVAGETWPAVYHACGNSADGLTFDVVDNASFWNWGITPHVNVPMEVYVR
jgi:hypothetical protein